MAETLPKAPFQEMDISQFDPVAFWEKLGGGWDLFLNTRYGTTVYIYTHRAGSEVSVNLGLKEVHVHGFQAIRATKIRLYAEPKIEIDSEDLSFPLTIQPDGVYSSGQQPRLFPFGNPPLGGRAY